MGNNIIQVCNALEIAENEGGRVILPQQFDRNGELRKGGRGSEQHTIGFYQVFNAPEGQSSDGFPVIQVKKVKKVKCKARGLARSFPYWPANGNGKDCFTQDERHRVMETYLKPLLKPSNVVVDPEELVIHIRGGDLFTESSGLSHYHEGSQPPCAAYDHVIEKVKFKKVRIVAADTLNPCAAEVQKRNPDVKVTLQSSGMLEDFMTMVNAHHLFLSHSTFSSTAYTMSNTADDTYSMRCASFLNPGSDQSNMSMDYRTKILLDTKKSEGEVTFLEAPEQCIQYQKEVPDRINWMKSVKKEDIQPIGQ